MPVKEVSVDCNSGETEKGIVRNFPKSKRQTPEDIGCLPLAHICSVDDNIQSFRWMIHYGSSGLHFLCANCGIALTLEEITEIYADL